MRFSIGTHYGINSLEVEPFLALQFEFDGVRLVALGPSHQSPDVVINPFDPARDIAYLLPEPLTPTELEEEATIHVPQPICDRMGKRIVPGTLGGLALMQYELPAPPAISPLAALGVFIKAVGSVNSAIVQADNSGMLFVGKSGTELHAKASAHSISELLSIGEEERKHMLPDFQASEYLLSGSDLQHVLNNINHARLHNSRTVMIADFSSLCEFTPGAATVVELNPHLYTLMISAAAVFAEILRESKTLIASE